MNGILSRRVPFDQAEANADEFLAFAQTAHQCGCSVGRSLPQHWAARHCERLQMRAQALLDAAEELLAALIVHRATVWKFCDAQAQLFHIGQSFQRQEELDAA